ncbi:uncharacterized protein TNCV_774481 [Trichonephila clavipes]|nr:uncharacterized protein TNCV_774481 [Trichonephila clavipes]
MRQIARDIRISDRLVRRIAKTKLGLKPYKLRKVQLLTEKNELVRLRRCRKLLRQAASHRWERLLFIDEKLLTVQQIHNSHNYKIWCVDAPSISVIVEPHQYPKSVMIWGGICASGKTPLFLWKRMISQKVYQRDIIDAVLLPWDQKYFGKANWTLQQNSAPVCKAIKAQEWCQANFPDHLKNDHFNPMDSSMDGWVHFRIQGLH